jgi:hypothetical protein
VPQGSSAPHPLLATTTALTGWLSSWGDWREPHERQARAVHQ